LKKLWDDKENPAFVNKTLDIMEEYFEKWQIRHQQRRRIQDITINRRYKQNRWRN
jgi:hypothetical protein